MMLLILMLGWAGIFFFSVLELFRDNNEKKNWKVIAGIQASISLLALIALIALYIMRVI